MQNRPQTDRNFLPPPTSLSPGRLASLLGLGARNTKARRQLHAALRQAIPGTWPAIEPAADAFATVLRDLIHAPEGFAALIQATGGEGPLGLRARLLAATSAAGLAALAEASPPDARRLIAHEGASPPALATAAACAMCNLLPEASILLWALVISGGPSPGVLDLVRRHRRLGDALPDLAALAAATEAPPPEPRGRELERLMGIVELDASSMWVAESLGELLREAGATAPHLTEAVPVAWRATLDALAEPGRAEIAGELERAKRLLPHWELRTQTLRETALRETLDYTQIEAALAEAREVEAALGASLNRIAARLAHGD